MGGSVRLVGENTFHEHYDRQFRTHRDRQQTPASAFGVAGTRERRLARRNGRAAGTAATKSTGPCRLRLLRAVPALAGLDGPVQRRSESLWPGIRACRPPVRGGTEDGAEADLVLPRTQPPVP